MVDGTLNIVLLMVQQTQPNNNRVYTVINHQIFRTQFAIHSWPFTTFQYTTEVGQTVLNQTVLALLYEPCWPGLAQLTSAQFYDCLHSNKLG